tara:strand:+ start:694 stop:876 length:183 start_codon:yes stop_codon:yes gene_type:complete
VARLERLRGPLVEKLALSRFSAKPFEDREVGNLDNPVGQLDEAFVDSFESVERTTPESRN